MEIYTITLVGNIVSLREKIKWFELDHTLKGKTVILTCDNTELKNRFIQDGAEVVVLPLNVQIPNLLTVKIEHLLAQPSIAIGSEESVHVFFQYLLEGDVDLRTLKVELIAVDEAAQNALKSKGLYVPLLKGEKQSVSLLIGDETICKQYHHLASDTFITHRSSFHQGIVHCLRRLAEEKSEIPIVFCTNESLGAFIEIAEKENFRYEDLVLIMNPLLYQRNLKQYH